MVRLKVTTEKITCKNCGSTRIVKYGSNRQDSQYWLCRDCGKKFTDSPAVAGGKLPAECITYSLDSYYNGLSINDIRNGLKLQYGICPSSKTVFAWIQKYSKELTDKTKDLHPKVGNVWIADETYVRIDQRKKNNQVENPYEPGKGKWVIFWDIIDAKTRFLLASLVTTTRGTQDAKKLMELAEQRAGKTPKTVITDSLAAYLDGIEQAYGADTTHRQGGPFNIQNNTNLIERFHSTLKERTKVMRALRNKDTTQTFTDGWLAYYNFLRPHQYNENEKTIYKIPSEQANLICPFRDWNDIVKVPKTNPVQVEVTKDKPLTTIAKLPIYRKIRITPKVARLS